MRMRALPSVFCIFLTTASASAGTVWYVDDDGDTDSGCTSWEDACPELQTALGLVNAGDEIRVAQGTYGPAGPNGDRAATFQLPDEVVLLGGYLGLSAGKGEDPDDRDIELYETILSGDLNGDDAPNESNCCQLHIEPGCDDSACANAVCEIYPECCGDFWYFACATVAADLCTGVCGGNEENSFHVVTAVGTGPETTIDGLRISGGNTTGTTGNRDGGGLLGGSLSVRDCTFSGNRAWQRGGGMFADSPIVADCSFETNWGQEGGGIYLIGSGAVSGTGFVDNGASLHGGGVYLSTGAPMFTGCTFINNGVNSDGGGGIYNDGSDTVLVGCDFDGNFALAHSGGAVLSSGGDLYVNGCSFVGNTAFECCGGGVFLWHGNASLIMNSLFAGNKADWGGGLTLVESDASLINCTIVGNTALTGSGGGIFNQVSGHPLVANCILWDNSPNQVYELGASVETEIFHSNIDGGWLGAGSGNINSDPLFTNTEEGDYRLLPGSPCVDAADNNRVPAEITADLDADPRFVDDPDTEDTGSGECPIVDMGAYEYQEGATVCCPADLDGNGSVGPRDLAILLGFWGPNPDHPADLDGDGVVGPFDLALLLGAWGPCP